MRIGWVACVAAAVLSGAADAKAALAPVPHILVVNRSALLPADATANKAATEGAFQTILKRLMQQYGANMVLDSAAVIDGGYKVDITGQALEQLQKSMPSVAFDAGTPLAAVDTAAVAEPRIAIVDQARLLRARADSDASRLVLQQLMRERGANLLLDRAAVIFGTDGNLDLTSVALERLAQRSASAAPSAVNPPVIVEIDRVGMMRNSSVGRDLSRQVRELTARTQNELKPQSDALIAEKKALQSQIDAAGAPSPAVAAFIAKRQAFEQTALRRANQIRQGVAVARMQIDQALSSVVLDVMREHGANLMVDSGAVVATTSGAFDVTKAVIQQLDKKLPSVKVEPIDPPSNP
ncbi:MAG: OmpH family outer membrane protein [Rhizomicrobium sp.]